MKIEFQNFHGAHPPEALITVRVLHFPFSRPNPFGGLYLKEGESVYSVLISSQ